MATCLHCLICFSYLLGQLLLHHVLRQVDQYLLKDNDSNVT